MKKAALIEGTLTGGTFGTTTRNTGLSQRDCLEETIRNLATLTGAKEVHKRMSARGALFYAVDGKTFQSATNTILDLSRKIFETREGGGGRR